MRSNHVFKAGLMIKENVNLKCGKILWSLDCASRIIDFFSGYMEINNTFLN